MALGDPALDGTAAAIKSKEKDVDHDEDADLLLFFSICELVENGALDESSAELLPTGETLDGTPIAGSDSVLVVPRF